jgi:hypothetical protein
MAAFLVAACCVAGSTTNAQQPGGGISARQLATVLPIKRLGASAQGYSQFSGIADSLRIVIRDSTTWREYWRLLNTPFIPEPKLPVVDFDHEMIVLVALGSRPSAGYGIVIESAVADSGRLLITVRRLAPGSHCAVGAVITHPVDIVSVPAREGGVEFSDQVETSNCQKSVSPPRGQRPPWPIIRKSDQADRRSDGQ